MSADEDYRTPRSGRTKKKSALSKLAAKKKLVSDDDLSGSNNTLQPIDNDSYSNFNNFDHWHEHERLNDPQPTRGSQSDSRALNRDHSTSKSFTTQSTLPLSNGTRSLTLTSTEDASAETDSEDDEEYSNSSTHVATATATWRDQNNSHNKVLRNISSSDIDLRKHGPIEHKDYSEPKRTVSLSRREMDIPDADEQMIEMNKRMIVPPKQSANSPRSRQRQPSPTFLSAYSYERPTSGQSGKMRMTDLMSERSYASTSVMRQMTTKQAKNRSFLVGSAVSGSPLLGPEELERFFPDRQLRVFVGTWNMCEMKIIPDSLDDFIHPDELNEVSDMYVIGTQESCANRREWEIRLQEALGPHHVLIHSAAFGVLYLNIFLRKDLVWYCSVSEDDNCSTRNFSMFKTKGAVAACFTLFGTSMLFVNSHLAPHDGRGEDRVKDYHMITKSIHLPKVVKNIQMDYNGQLDVTQRFESVFWCGDLNWRIQKEHDRVKHKIGGIQSEQKKGYEELLEHDELTQVRNHDLAFTNFQEGRIKFPPTYKYDIGTNKFDTSAKLRIPSYTDRVLFKTKKKGTITCLHYNSVPSVVESDHKPVYAQYEVTLRPGRDNIPLSAGQFNREVWLEAMKRRALKYDVLQRNAGAKSSKMCSVQ